MLAALLDSILPRVCLYVNDPDIGPGMVADDFVEATFPGYQRITATKWSPPVLRSGLAFSVVDPLIFTYTMGDPGEGVRGYYVRDGDDGPVMWAWRRPDDAWMPTVENPTLLVFVTMTFPPSVS